MCYFKMDERSTDIAGDHVDQGRSYVRHKRRTCMALVLLSNGYILYIDLPVAGIIAEQCGD